MLKKINTLIECSVFIVKAYAQLIAGVGKEHRILARPAFWHPKEDHNSNSGAILVKYGVIRRPTLPASSLQHLLQIQFNLPQPQPQIQPASTSTKDLHFKLCSPVFSLQLCSPVSSLQVAAQFQAPVSSTALNLTNLSLEPSEKINKLKGYYLQKMTIKSKNKK